MKQYSVDFYRIGRKGEEWKLTIEQPAVSFTSRQFKDHVVRPLFVLAGEGIKNKHLVAYVKRDGEKFLTVRCDTVVDGSNITAYVTVARPRERYRLVRVMEIAC